ncbi:hydrogenase-1 expression HyaE [Kordiimonas lipolytica]|uniref:Hydrogenase-1 expression HyaE n=1 Tax=Kordiimonas lipolytica TaxID=1662421 RepID=A0ABV8UBN9_9PROT
MYSPLLESIVERENFKIMSADELEAYAPDREDIVLFFAGDAARMADSDDVAVVLPELVKAFENIFEAVIVHRESERALQLKYRFNAYPALVFLRKGDYLGTIQKIQDWTDYINEISDILKRSPSAPPPYSLPDGCATQPQQPAN